MTVVKKYSQLNVLFVINFVFTVKCACDCFNTTKYFSSSDNVINCFCKRFSPQSDSFHENVKILTLEQIDTEVFDSRILHKFKEDIIDLCITKAENLKKIEDDVFNKFSNLQSLYITKIPKLQNLSLEIFQNVSNSKLRHLTVVKTGLKYVPKIHLDRQIFDTVDFEGNSIELIETNKLRIQANLVIFNYNKISEIQPWAFNNSKISNMSFKGNRELQMISEDAFSGLQSLFHLDLSETSIKKIPTSGLNELEVLIIKDTYTLKTIPSIYDLNNLQEAVLTYFFHCCAFSLPEQHDAKKFALHQQYIEKLKELCNVTNKENNAVDKLELTNVATGERNYGEDERWDDELTDNCTSLKVTNKSDLFSSSSFKLENNSSILCGNIYFKKNLVHCSPSPNAFNPCEDIMGFTWLRISIWFIVIIALFGNICVLAVIFFKSTEMTVQNFLILNLAFSDLCMAIFLLLLAIEDFISEGNYFNFAYDWQQGIGCQIAGFITIFSNQLSIFVLCLLTIERWFTIKKALHIHKLTFHKIVFVTFCGWFYAVSMAVLPLLGISSYSTTSLCLPMNTENRLDQIYVVFLLMFSSTAFITICICYFQIYFSLSYETRHKDGEYVLARKMTILVTTNFASWAPITFFALTAVSGFPLIDIPRSKILLVFFYPLNSCANPFLYAILTSNFKKDFISLVSKFGVCKNAAESYKLIYYQPKGNYKNEIQRPSTSHTIL